MPEPAQLIAYHYVVEGRLFMSIAGQAPLSAAAGHLLVLPFDAPPGGKHLLLDSLGMVEQFEPGPGGLYAARRAIEQPRAERLFKRGHAARERRVVEPEALAARHEAAASGYRQEQAEVVPVEHLYFRTAILHLARRYAQ